MPTDPPADNFYALLGLARACTPREIRDAYRILARRYHPDLNHNDPEAHSRSQSLNAAYEVLSDPARRRTYDRDLDRASKEKAPKGRAKIEHNIKEEVRLRIEDFLSGTTINVVVKDPANPADSETYRVAIPPLTAPGARLRVPRVGMEGVVELRLKTLTGYRFKARGSDLRTDLRVSAQRAAAGGSEMLERPTGGMLRVPIPARAQRGELVRIAGEGLPRPRGGRGDLLVRITYRPEVRISRTR